MKDLQSLQQQDDLLQTIKELNDHVAKLKDGKSDKEVETKWLTNPAVLTEKKGSELIIEHTGLPIHNKNRKMIGGVLVIRDVTEKTKTGVIGKPFEVQELRAVLKKMIN